MRRSKRTTPPSPPCRYFADEVDEAQRYTARWAGCLLHGMSETEILTWIHALDAEREQTWPPSQRLDADVAIALKTAGITPYNLRWHYGDELHGTLVQRLRRRQMTIDEVILEAQRRRGQQD